MFSCHLAAASSESWQTAASARGRAPRAGAQTGSSSACTPALHILMIKVGHLVVCSTAGQCSLRRSGPCSTRVADRGDGWHTDVSARHLSATCWGSTCPIVPVILPQRQLHTFPAVTVPGRAADAFAKTAWARTVSFQTSTIGTPAWRMSLLASCAHTSFHSGDQSRPHSCTQPGHGGPSRVGPAAPRTSLRHPPAASG